MRTSRYIAQSILNSSGTSYIKLILQLATAAIALSLAVMILTISVISGFEKDISEKIFDFWGHITIKDLNSRGSLESEPIDSVDVFKNKISGLNQVTYSQPTASDEWVEKQSNAGVKAVQSFINLPAILQSKETMEGVRLKGLSTKEKQDQFLNAYLTQGNWLDDSDSTNQIVISESLSDRLELKMDDALIVHLIYSGRQIPKKFRVQGIYSTGLEEFDSRTAIVNINFIRDIVGWDNQKVGGLEILLEDLSDIDAYVDYLNYNVLPQNLYAESIRSQLRSLFEWLSLQDVNKTLILSLLTIVCLINMTTVLFILILERSQMIGILKSLGAGNWLLREVFLYYAAYILVRAMIIGNLIGIGLSVIQYYTHLINLDEKNYYLSYVPISFEWWQYLLVNLGCFLVTVLFMIIPSMLVARVNPVKVLRFE